MLNTDKGIKQFLSPFSFNDIKCIHKKTTGKPKVINLKLSDKTGYTLFLISKLFNHSYHNWSFDIILNLKFIANS